MTDTNPRLISDDERNTLYDIIQDKGNESGYRAKIILLKDEGYTVPEIRRMTNHHDVNIRNGIVSKIHRLKPVKISDDMEKKIVDIATKNPKRRLWTTLLNVV